MQPVSYTHLDVYKRQELASVASGRRAASEREKVAVERRVQEAEQDRLRQKSVAAEMDAPAKRQIGATLCMVRNGMGYACLLYTSRCV